MRPYMDSLRSENEGYREELLAFANRLKEVAPAHVTTCVVDAYLKLVSEMIFCKSCKY